MLDKINQKIIRLLQEDARRTNVDIARSIEMSEPTVKNRIDSMVKSGILKVLAALNPEALGYFAKIIILVRAQPGQLIKLGEKLLLLNEVSYLSYIAGNFDIIIEVLLREHNQLFQFISGTLSRIPEIFRIEYAYILKTERISYEWEMPDSIALTSGVISSIQPVTIETPPFKINQEKIKTIPPKIHQIDNVDKNIIRLIQENGRRTNASIARSIEMSEPTVKNRIDRMIEKRILHILAIIDPKSLGYTCDNLFGICVIPGQLEKVGRKLLSLHEVVYIGYHSRHFDIFIEVLLRNLEEYFEFISKTMGKISGIQSIERFHIIKNEKINYEWKLSPDQFIID